MTNVTSIKTYTLTWTEQTIANDVAPDTDTAIPTARATRIHCAWDTNGADTGSPDFDFHIETDVDGTNYTDTHYATLASAVAKDKRGSAMLTPPGKTIKARLDVNTANLAATEFVKLYITVYY